MSKTPFAQTNGTAAVEFYSKCPLVAQSGHSNHSRECPLLGVKRTSQGIAVMSAYDPKRT